MATFAWIKIIQILSLSACVIAPELNTDPSLPTKQQWTQENPSLITERSVQRNKDQQEAYDDNTVQKEIFENEVGGSQFAHISDGERFGAKSSAHTSNEEDDLIDLKVTKENDVSNNQHVHEISDNAMPSLQKLVADEKPVELAVGDIQSFEEWKKNQIQSQEDTASTELHIPPHRVSRAKKMNYASQDCGAKVLTHNPEAKNVGAILDENKDLYLLNPCSNEIWFVIELCEPIQVQQVQLANLELFSSMPGMFDVSISERFPAREWRLLDTFEAQNERLVQSFFPKREPDMFAKYIKFEMRSFFGNEHFCPLTLTRVFGVSMEEEYEDAAEEKVVEENILKLKDILASNDVETEDINNAHTRNHAEGGSIEKMLDIVKTAVGNLLANKPPAANAISTTSGAPTPDLNVMQEETFDPNWESPVTLVTNRSEMETTTSRTSRPPLVTLIETGTGQDIVPSPRSSTPLHPLQFLSSFSADDFSTAFCFFLEFVYRISVLSCVVQPYGNHTSGYAAFPLVIDKKNPKPPTTRSEAFPAPPAVESIEKPWNFDFAVSETNSNQFVDEKVDTKAPFLQLSLTPQDKMMFSNAMEDVTVENQETSGDEDSAIAQSTITTKHAKSTPGSSKLDSSHVTHGTVTLDSSGFVLKPSNVDQIQDQIADKEEIGTADNGNDKVRFSGFKDTIIHYKQDEDLNNVNRFFRVISEDPASPDLSKSPFKDVNKFNTPDDGASPSYQDYVFEAASSPSTSSEPSTPSWTIHEENASKVAAVTSVEEHDTVSLATGTTQKESVVRRMNNRIRILEKNVSLSSAYLENLSQRFKRQTDEMQRVFQQTEKRLEETTEAVEETNKHLFQVSIMEKINTEILNKKTRGLADSFDYLNRCMIARHLCLMALESICFVVICVTCFGVRQIRLTRRLRRAETKMDELLLRQPSLHEGEITLFLEKKKAQNKYSNFNAKRKSERTRPSTKRSDINFTNYYATNVSSLRSSPHPTSESLYSMTQCTKSQKVSKLQKQRKLPKQHPKDVFE